MPTWPAVPCASSSARSHRSHEILLAVSPARAEALTEPGPPDLVLKALADPHRRQILRLVRGGELAAGEIASHFDATQQAVSHHLQVLARAGLLRERRDGVRRLYALDPRGLDPVREVLSDLWPAALERLKIAVERDQKEKR